ncbi:hypothetical protein BJX68DRAFT_105195 [Aspergillus pseudodeflectus]|uniref:Secreted protein n=1 Tax=Aspergillus pseudodeflectus TaxID=176178 RepID=A0ABR4K6M6_9EURO
MCFWTRHCMELIHYDSLFLLLVVDYLPILVSIDVLPAMNRLLYVIARRYSVSRSPSISRTCAVSLPSSVTTQPIRHRTRPRLYVPSEELRGHLITLN